MGASLTGPAQPSQPCQVPWRRCAGQAHRRGVPGPWAGAHDASDRRRPGRAGRPERAEDRTRPAGATATAGPNWWSGDTRQRAEAANRGRHVRDRGRKRPGPWLADPQPTERNPHRQRPTRTDRVWVGEVGQRISAPRRRPERAAAPAPAWGQGRRSGQRPTSPADTGRPDAAKATSGGAVNACCLVGVCV